VVLPILDEWEQFMGFSSYCIVLVLRQSPKKKGLLVNKILRIAHERSQRKQRSFYDPALFSSGTRRGNVSPAALLKFFDINSFYGWSMLWVEQGNETSGKQPNNHITTEFCSENKFQIILDQSGQFQNEIQCNKRGCKWQERKRRYRSTVLKIKTARFFLKKNKYVKSSLATKSHSCLGKH